MSDTEGNEPQLFEDVDDDGGNVQFGEPIEPNDAEKPDEEEDGETKKVPVKRTHRPQPKLDAERLKGNRGLTALKDVFKDVQFRGRGYEKEDLDVLLKRYEYWCHRLFPKLPFDACVEKIEKLKSKKAVMTYVKLIRMDMVVDESVPDLPPLEGSQEPEIPVDDIFPTTNINVEPEISEEQLERMRLNRERAQQRRREILLRNQNTHNSNVMD